MPFLVSGHELDESDALCKPEFHSTFGDRFTVSTRYIVATKKMMRAAVSTVNRKRVHEYEYYHCARVDNLLALQFRRIPHPSSLGCFVWPMPQSSFKNAG